MLSGTYRLVAQTLGVAALIASLVVLPGCDEQDKSAKKEAAAEVLPAVTVAPVVARDIAEQVEFVGQANAFQKVEMRARVTGFLRERPFKEGGPVKKDELLYLIEPEEYQATVQASEATIQRTMATIEESDRDFER